MDLGAVLTAEIRVVVMTGQAEKGLTPDRHLSLSAGCGSQIAAALWLHAHRLFGVTTGLFIERQWALCGYTFRIKAVSDSQAQAR